MNQSLKNQLIRAVNGLNLMSGLLLILSFPVYYGKIFHLQHWSVLVFFISYCIELFLEKKWQTFTWDKSKWVFIVFLAYFFIQILYFPFENNTHLYGKILEQRMAFLGFGIVGLFGFNKFYKIRYVAFMFILSGVLVSGYLLFDKIGIHNFILSNDKVQLFALERIKNIHGHMIFNSFLNVALIFVFYLLLIEKKYPFSKVINVFAILLGGFIYYILFISDGRTGFVVANCIVLMAIFYTLWNWKKTLAIIVTGVAMLAMVFIILNHPRINAQTLKREARFAIWDVAIKVIKEKPLLGYGASTAADVFMEKGSNDKEFIEVGDAFLLEMMVKRDIQGGNPHNIFLKSIMEYGVFGLAIILCLFIFPVIFAKKPLKFIVFLCVFSVVFQLFFEVFPTGILPLMFCLVIAVLLSPPKQGFETTSLNEA